MTQTHLCRNRAQEGGKKKSNPDYESNKGKASGKKYSEREKMQRASDLSMVKDGQGGGRGAYEKPTHPQPSGDDWGEKRRETAEAGEDREISMRQTAAQKDPVTE